MKDDLRRHALMMREREEAEERARAARYVEIERLRMERDALRASLIRACNATDGQCRDDVSSEFLSHVGAEVEGCIRRLRAEVERLRTPDMFWDADGNPVEDWIDALDAPPPLEVQDLATARDLGSRYAVYIPRDDRDDCKWRDDAHLFATREEAEAAVTRARGEK